MPVSGKEYHHEEWHTRQKQMQSWTLLCLSLRLVWIWHSVPVATGAQHVSLAGRPRWQQATSSRQPVLLMRARPRRASNTVWYFLPACRWDRLKRKVTLRAEQCTGFCHPQSLFAGNSWNLLSVILINLQSWAMLGTLSNKSRKSK